MTLPSPIKCPPFIYSKNEPGMKKESYLPKSPTSPLPNNSPNKKRVSLTAMPYTETISSLSRKHATLLKEIQETKQLLEESNLKQHKYNQLHKKQEKANKKITLKYTQQYYQNESPSSLSTLSINDWEKRIQQNEKEYQLAKQKCIQTQEQLKYIRFIYHQDFQQHNNSRQHYLSLLQQLLDLIKSLKSSYDHWMHQMYYTYPYYLFLTCQDDNNPNSTSCFLTTLNTLKTSTQSHMEKDQLLLQDMDQSINYFTEISNQYCEDIVLK